MGFETTAPSARKTIKVKLEASVSLGLRAEAKRWGVEYDEFAAKIIDAVVKHGLYAAVLEP